MSQRSGLYPHVRVDTAAVPAVAHAGGALLTKTARVAGIDRYLSNALRPWRKPLARHDPAKVLLDVAVSLALGGDACRDTALLRAESGVYGPVASDATISRTIAALAGDVARVEKAIAAARATARAHVWDLAGDLAPSHGIDAATPLVIDLDATYGVINPSSLPHNQPQAPIPGQPVPPAPEPEEGAENKAESEDDEDEDFDDGGGMSISALEAELRDGVMETLDAIAADFDAFRKLQEKLVESC